MIEIQNLEKTFKVLKRKQGLKGAVTDLFSKDYNYIKAVDDLSLTIGDGEIVGYVGPNGAGKSTTIKMMTGILLPTSGTITIAGENPAKNRRNHMKNIGVVFGQRSQLWWSLPVMESFRVLKEIYEVEDKVFEENLKLFESMVDIKALYNKPVRQLSLGQRMLCEVAASFLHDPKVVFLDEPTIGLDVSVKDSIRTLIKQLNAKKHTTIVLTSHDTKDIETLCERVAIIDKGKLIFDNNINHLKEMFGKYRTIRINLKEENGKKLQLTHKLLEFYPGDCLRISEDEEDRKWLNIVVNEQRIELTEVLNQVLSNFTVTDVQIMDVGIEEVIKKIYERERPVNEAI